MHVDAITLAAVADEWRTLLTNARIDTIIQPTEYALAIQCYAPAVHGEGGGQNRWLYLSAHPQLARAHITARRPAKINSEPPPFVMLLRKYLEGARVEAIQQPRWERVIELQASHRTGPGSDDRSYYRLIIEIMGRLSNIIFCDEHNNILGSLKRVGAEINRYRTIAPNVQYVPPPAQHHSIAGQSLPKIEPVTVTAAELSLCAVNENEEAHAENLPTTTSSKARKRPSTEPDLWHLLTKHLLGFSPLIAREAVYRTTGNTETPLASTDTARWEELAWNVRELAALFDSHYWQPQLVERVAAGEHQPALTSSPQTVPLAFAPYVLEQYAETPGILVRQSPSINVLLDDFYARSEWRDAMEGVRNPVRKVLQAQRDRCKRKADLLQLELDSLKEGERYRLQAELLLTYQQQVNQGQTTVTLQNLFEGDDEQDAPVITFAIDPRFDAVGNANRLFNRYHKLRRAAALLPAQIERNATELATIEQLLADLMLADTPAEVALVKAEVQSAGYMRGGGALASKEKKSQKAPKKGKGGKPLKGKPVPPGGGVPLHLQSRDGFTILVGKNSRQNEEVTFHQAAANDIWLHARGVPGAHVIIKAAGRDIPVSTIEQAASVAAFYSQSRGTTTTPVDYTLQRHVRHMKGGGPGMVIYERERTVYVAPENPQL